MQTAMRIGSERFGAGVTTIRDLPGQGAFPNTLPSDVDGRHKPGISLRLTAAGSGKPADPLRDADHMTKVMPQQRLVVSLVSPQRAWPMHRARLQRRTVIPCLGSRWRSSPQSAAYPEGPSLAPTTRGELPSVSVCVGDAAYACADSGAAVRPPAATKSRERTSAGRCHPTSR
jgi:hypothetical protein